MWSCGVEITVAREVLKVNLSCQLDDPRVASTEYAYKAGIADVGGDGATSHCPRWIELGVVEQVEELKAQFQPCLFGDGGAFVEAEVEVGNPGSPQEVATCVAKRPRGLYGERIGSEPIVVEGRRVDRSGRRVYELAGW